MLPWLKGKADENCICQNRKTAGMDTAENFPEQGDISVPSAGTEWNGE